MYFRNRGKHGKAGTKCTRISSLAIALASAASIVAACGSSSAVGDAPSSQENSAESAQSGEASQPSGAGTNDASSSFSGEIHVAAGIDPSFAQSYVADAKGYWKELGLKVSVISMASGSDAVKSVFAGQNDVVQGSSLAFVSGLTQGGKITIVAGTRPKIHEFGAIVTTANIKTPTDLYGKKIGISQGSVSSDLFFGLYKKAHNLDPDKINIVYLKPQDALLAFEQGNIDAMAMWGQWYEQALASVSGSHVLAYDYEDGVYTHADIDVGVSDALVENHPDVVQRLVKGYVQADEFMSKNPDETVEILAKALNQDEKSIADILGEMTLRVHLSPDTVTDLCQGLDFLRSQGKADSEPDWSAAIDTSFLANAAPDRMTLESIGTC